LESVNKPSLDAMFRVEGTNLINSKLKKSLFSKLKNIAEGASVVEKASGFAYPPYYVEPILTVVESYDNTGGLGVLYARTRPVETGGVVIILVELSAPLVLFGTKSFLKLVMAHEMLHYIELVRSFTKMDIASQITSSSIFEESFVDTARTIDPAKIYSDKKLAALLKKRERTGFTDEKLNEKCRVKWIEKGLPTTRIPVGRNQANVSVESIIRTKFDPRLKDFVARLT
jgi:hypothetical protein